MMSVSLMMMLGWDVEVVDLSEVSRPESLLICRTMGLAGKDCVELLLSSAAWPPRTSSRLHTQR